MKIIKNIWIQDKFTDTDRDGVPNFRDCNPWNPQEQHIFEKYRDIKFEKKKMRELGLICGIFKGKKGKYVVLAGKIGEDQASFVETPRKMFDGTLQQCQKWMYDRDYRY